MGSNCKKDENPPSAHRESLSRVAGRIPCISPSLSLSRSRTTRRVCAVCRSTCTRVGVLCCCGGAVTALVWFCSKKLKLIKKVVCDELRKEVNHLQTCRFFLIPAQNLRSPRSSYEYAARKVDNAKAGKNSDLVF